MRCRHCDTELTLPLIDLGSSPPSNAYLTEGTLHKLEKWYPLRVLVCEQCWLVQTEDFAQADELFDENYAYFSSFSTSWLEHAEQYVENMHERFSLNESSHVVEVAANDGYLLQYVRGRNIPCTGIEPTISTATVACEKGIPIIKEFFSVILAQKLVKQNKQADLTIANNVLAHVPNINDFTSGFSILLKPNGVATFEFPHLLKLINGNQFDTIYHEHFSYLSLIAVEAIFKKNGLQVFDVEEHKTHGGSLRIFAQRSDTGMYKITERVVELRKHEMEAGINSVNFYKNFQVNVNRIKNDLLSFLIKAKKDEKKVIAYGAAAKGNTLLNYSGIRPDLLECVIDINPAKQGKYMPGSRIPILSIEYLKKNTPDYILILPWNLANEVYKQNYELIKSGVEFVTAIPNLNKIKAIE
jgi:2-polyprenyl-3-methyl-5-hydroxy-6-metoxy-1,4-benzoquinol methylase